MLAYDHVSVSPTPATLNHLLETAINAANRGYRARLLRLSPKELRSFRSAYRRQAEGVQEWRNLERSQSQSFSTAGVAWWSDPLGYKHTRVTGARPDNVYADLNAFGLDERPPLGLVYPGRTFLRECKGAKELVAACACGAWGTPASLGWMGDCCGPCHDRKESGESIPGSEFPARTVLECPEGLLEQLIFTPYGRILLGRPAYEGAINLWALTTGAPVVYSFARPHRRFETLGGLALAPDGLTAVVTRANNTVPPNLEDTGGLFWGLGGGEGPALQTDRFLHSLAFSPDGRTLAALTEENFWLQQAKNLQLFDTRGRLLRETTVKGVARGLAFSPDGRLLAVGCEGDEPVCLLDPTTGRQKARLRGSLDGVDCLAFSPDGGAIAAGISTWNDVSLRVWRWPGGKEVFTAPDPFSSLAFSPDGRLLAGVGRSKLLRLWRVRDGKQLGRFFWHGTDIEAVAFSPDGRWLATGDWHGLIRLWPVPALIGTKV